MPANITSPFSFEVKRRLAKIIEYVNGAVINGEEIKNRLRLTSRQALGLVSKGKSR
jgi:hypothetical protein